MSQPVIVVKNFYEAFGAKDWVRLRSLIADDFTFRGSMAAFDNPDDFVRAMSQLPFEGYFEDSKFITEGDQVVHSFLWKMTSPATSDIHMCEVFEVSGEKIKVSELYYDSAAMPSSG